jgi:HAMP domain-containing protein
VVAVRPRLSGVRVRVTFISVVVVGFALAAGAGLLLRAQRNSLEDDIATTARLRAADVAAAVGEGALPSAITVSRQEEGVVQVLDAQRKVVASSANIAGAPPISDLAAPDTGSATTKAHVSAISTNEFWLVALRSTRDTQSYTVYVAASLEPAEKSVRTLGKLLTFGLPALLALVGVVTWFVVGRALGPVESIRREVEAISERDLHRRVPEPVVQDEIGRLAHTMNAMLSRLELATARQRRFVADASHELRNPLTSIRAQLEVDRAHPGGADWEATRTDVLAETVRLQRLVDDTA